MHLKWMKRCFPHSPHCTVILFFLQSFQYCMLLRSSLMHILYLAPAYWCISRSYGRPLVLSSLETGVNRVGGSEGRLDGAMEGSRECLDLICVIILGTAGLMLQGSYTLTHKLNTYLQHAHVDKQAHTQSSFCPCHVYAWLSLTVFVRCVFVCWNSFLF